jgi:hypothetical protein
MTHWASMTEQHWRRSASNQDRRWGPDWAQHQEKRWEQYWAQYSVRGWVRGWGLHLAWS